MMSNNVAKSTKRKVGLFSALFGVVLVFLASMTFAPTAKAQDNPVGRAANGVAGVLGGLPGIMNNEDNAQAFAECASRQNDKSAAHQLVDKEGVPAPEGWDSDESVQKLKEEHPERFQEILDHYNNQGGLRGAAGDIADMTQCTVSNPFDTAGKIAKDETSEFWEDPLGKAVKALIAGNTQALETAMTFWTEFSLSPEETTKQSGGVRNIVWTIAGSAFIISLVITGARIAASRRQGLADGMEDFGKFYGSYLVAGVMVPLAVPIGLSGTDFLTKQILTGLPEGKGLSDLIEQLNFGEGALEPALMLILVLFALVGSVTQMVALAARALILPIVVGFLPIAASSAATNAGKTSLGSMLSWIFAALAFKPIAAMTYVVAFWIAGGDSLQGNETVVAITKLLVLGMAGFSPLMVLKIVSPLMASASGPSSAAVGGALGGATGAAGGAVLGGAAIASGGASRVLGGVASAAGGKSGGPGGSGGSGSGGGGRPMGGSTGGPSGGGPAGGSPAGGGPAGGGPSGGGPGGGAGPSGGAGATGGVGGASTGTSSGQREPAYAGTGGSAAQASTSAGSGAGSRAAQAGGVARAAVAGTAGAASRGAGMVAGGARVASRAARHSGRAISRSSSALGPVFEDAGGAIRK